MPTTEPDRLGAPAAELHQLLGKAQSLVEALPRMQQLAGKRIVIKYGGAAMKSLELRGAVMQDVAVMKCLGMRPVLVHGGGPAISSVMDRVGKRPEFVDGLRVTDADTMQIVQMALVGTINREIVALLGRHGIRAVGLSGHDATLLRARRRVHTDSRTNKERDLGFVGDVEAVDTAVLSVLEHGEMVPVIAPVGVDDQGHGYNINADTVAAAIASALRAHLLVLLTDVEGVRADPERADSVVSELTVAEISAALGERRLVGGMIPKAQACVAALQAGVGRVHIADGRVPHVLLLHLFCQRPPGTLIVP